VFEVDAFFHHFVIIHSVCFCFFTIGIVEFVDYLRLYSVYVAQIFVDNMTLNAKSFNVQLACQSDLNQQLAQAVPPCQLTRVGSGHGGHVYEPSWPPASWASRPSPCVVLRDIHRKPNGQNRPRFTV